MAEDKSLKKSLGLFDVILFGVGGIIGAGIYAIIGEAAGLSGNMLWASFLLAAIVALLTGLCYAEFVSRFPDAGGSFEYVKKGLGNKTALALSVVMFLTGIVAPAAIAISFSDYLTRLVEIPGWISTVGIIALMVFISTVGMRESSWFNNLATIITLAGLAMVVVIALPEWGKTDLLDHQDVGWTGLLSGSAIIFFSYVGFEDLVKMAEETKEPRKNLPRAIIISAIIVLVIYLLIAISAINVLTVDELSKSKGPLAEIVSKLKGQSWATALIIVALFATSKTILSNTISASRLIFDVARDNDIKFLNRFSKVDKESGTPKLAVLFVGVCVVAFALIGNLKLVATISNIFVFVLFLIVNSSLIKYRLDNTGEKEKPSFMMPWNVNNVSILSYLAITGLLVLFGFNIANLF